MGEYVFPVLGTNLFWRLQLVVTRLFNGYSKCKSKIAWGPNFNVHFPVYMYNCTCVISIPFIKQKGVKPLQKEHLKWHGTSLCFHKCPGTAIRVLEYWVGPILCHLLFFVAIKPLSLSVIELLLLKRKTVTKICCDLVIL